MAEAGFHDPGGGKAAYHFAILEAARLPICISILFYSILYTHNMSNNSFGYIEIRKWSITIV
ncbi:unnamed protein product [Urochloa humidicola]